MLVDNITIIPKNTSEINTMLLSLRRYDKEVGDFPHSGTERESYFPVRAAIKKLRKAKSGKPLILTFEEWQAINSSTERNRDEYDYISGPSTKESKYLLETGTIDRYFYPHGHYIEKGG